jgi:hypothetical protein
MQKVSLLIVLCILVLSTSWLLGQTTQSAVKAGRPSPARRTSGLRRGQYCKTGLVSAHFGKTGFSNWIIGIS